MLTLNMKLWGQKSLRNVFSNMGHTGNVRTVLSVVFQISSVILTDCSLLIYEVRTVPATNSRNVQVCVKSLHAPPSVFIYFFS